MKKRKSRIAILCGTTNQHSFGTSVGKSEEASSLIQRLGNFIKLFRGILGYRLIFVVKYQKSVDSMKNSVPKLLSCIRE